METHKEFSYILFTMATKGTGMYHYSRHCCSHILIVILLNESKFNIGPN